MGAHLHQFFQLTALFFFVVGPSQRGSTRQHHSNPSFPTPVELGPLGGLAGNTTNNKISALRHPLEVNCFARCVSKCVESNQTKDVKQCENSCSTYGKPNLCLINGRIGHPECPAKCKDLGVPRLEDVKFLANNKIDTLSVVYNSEYKIDANWNPVQGTKIYLLLAENEDAEKTHLITKNSSIENYVPTLQTMICQSLELRVAVANNGGIGLFTMAILEKPKPAISAKLNLISLTFEKTPFVSSDYNSNGTITLILEYNLNKWPLGPGDLDVRPIFHMISCELSDFENAIPEPEFKPINNSTRLIGKMAADLMYRQCRFIYVVNEIYSRECGASYHIQASNPDYSTLILDCENVKNSQCYRNAPAKPPVCGQVKNYSYHWTQNSIQSNISAKITFEPNARQKPLYFVAFYGHAIRYDADDEKLLLGVNMTDIIGNSTNCQIFDLNKICQKASDDYSIVLDGLTPGVLYGVTICSIFDQTDLTFPSLDRGERYERVKAEALYIKFEEKSTGGQKRNHFIIAFSIAGVLLAFVILIVWQRMKTNDKRTKQVNMATLRIEQQQKRYVDLVKTPDHWELERQNLIIYNDKKLGAGAFGAVYFGKLIGISRPQTPRNIHLLRLNSDQSYVAVKMLPEYADEMSKSEFLREISLMKTLGYHERLVNMIACITKSEPYCLVVEYSSNGDLLGFLRERCKYMLELSDAKIDYANPECDAEFNREMVMSVKQLLMFAVQISYGLEYLTQKGFVHRDVAARNVLVHENNYAKIGDFGLCRFIYADSSNYKGRGGRLPIKWMSPEAIRHYEFTSSSDVWSFGILMFEIITLGGTPYPGIQPDDMLEFLESGNRIPQPDNCPDEFYDVMMSCWEFDPRKRPEFSAIRQQLAHQLEIIADEYSYLKLDAQKDYYNVSYNERREQDRNLDSFDRKMSPK